MSNGGVFQLVTNDGKQDRMLMATALLHERLDKVWREKKALNPGMKDDDIRVLPSLMDIEKTHILFTNAHFKPFAAIGFEYNKVRTSSGTPALGQTISFNIPQFGDFFHDIAFHCVLSQPTVTADAGVDSQDTPAFRWAAFPGERLLKKVTQEVNGNPLDEYTFHATVFHRLYRVAPNKRSGWDKCVGQESAEKGFLRQNDWASSGSLAESFRVAQSVYNGNQTPTATKSSNLEMFIPLLFWYNKDVRLAVPSVAIPHGQRDLKLELASAAELVGLVPRGANLGNWSAPGGTLSDPTLVTAELYINNIFVNPEVHKIYIKRVGFSLIRVHRQQQHTLSSNELLLSSLKWPIEYMFLGVKVRNYFDGSTDALKRQYLADWDKFSVVTETTYQTAGQTILQTRQLVEDPTTTLGIDVAGALSGTATANIALAAGDQVRINGALYIVEDPVAAGAALVGTQLHPVTAFVTAASAGVAASAAKVLQQGLEVQTKACSPILDTVSVQAHGIDLYKELPAGFFSSYTSYHYGGPNINTPEDCGALFIPFCLYPGTYQPSGHINISRAREFYFKYTSTYQVNNPSVNLQLIIVASAINFLLISDGSAVLRYST